MIAIEDSLGLWIPQVQGQYINMDWNPQNKGFGAQCWDLQAHWSNFLGLPIINTGNTAAKSGRWPGWAGNMVDCFPQTPEIAAAYTIHWPSEAGRPGDILVWGDSNKVWYPATHTAVLVLDRGSWLHCMSLNSTPSRADNPYPEWTSGPTTIQSLPREGLIGFIRPRIGGITYAGTTTEAAPNPEEDFMGGLIDAEQAEAIAERAATLVFEKLDNRLRINAVQAESIVQATTERTSATVDANASGKQIDRQQADDIARAAAQYNQEHDAALYAKESK